MARGVGLGAGMTALRAALGAAVGGLEGYTQAQELQRKRMLEQQALDRQNRMDALSLSLQKADLAEKNWLTKPELEQERQKALGGIGMAATSALMGAQAPFTPPPQYMGEMQQGLQAVGRGVLSQQMPSIDVGGTTMYLPESGPRRQERLAQEARYDADRKAAQERDFKQRESVRKQSLIARALSKTATEEDKAAAMAEGLLTPGQTGYLTAAEKANIAQQDRMYALQAKKINAEIDKMTGKADTGKPLSPPEMARLSEAQASARTASIYMNGIEKSWANKKTVINPLDVARVQELMESKGFTAGKALAAIWGANPMGLDAETKQELESYMAYAKMHSNAIRLIAARGGSNLLQQTEQQLVNAAWSGGGPEDIARARAARDAINESLDDAMQASGINTQLSLARQQRTGGGLLNVPPAPSGGSLEQQFPGQQSKIQEARRNGWSDAQIRAHLQGGR